MSSVIDKLFQLPIETVVLGRPEWRSLLHFRSSATEPICSSG